jgi:hypothetical protein
MSARIHCDRRSVELSNDENQRLIGKPHILRPLCAADQAGELGRQSPGHDIEVLERPATRAMASGSAAAAAEKKIGSVRVSMNFERYAG